LAETDLVVTRRALESLDDMVYVLASALEDVERDLSLDASPEQVKMCLDWLLEAARPLVGASERLRGQVGTGAK
jgi:hypothetical protein